MQKKYKNSFFIVLLIVFSGFSNSGIFLSFDDPRSIKEKVEYANKHNLKGVMVWHAGHDNGELITVIDKNLLPQKEFIVYIFNANSKNLFTIADLEKLLDQKVKISTVIFSFLHPHADGKVTLDTQEDQQLIKDLQALKNKYPIIQLLMSLGGWALKEGFFNAVKQGSLKKLAYNAVVKVQECGFDGLDIDWEYEEVQFAIFKKEFNQFVKYAKQAIEVKNKKLLLTVALPQNITFYKEQDLKPIIPDINWINLMSYNYEGPSWSEITGHNAPLYSHYHPHHRRWKKEHHFESVDSTIQSMLNNKIPSQKIVLGIPFYGRAFGGVKNKDTGLYQVHTGGIKLFGGFSDAVAYKDVVQFVDQKDNNGWTYYWDDECKVPYLFNPTGKV